MIELLVLCVCVKVIIEFVRSGNREVQNRDLRRTYKNLTDEQRAYVVRYYNQMKSEGRI
mgnify:CR=1 FL=1